MSRTVLVVVSIAAAALVLSAGSFAGTSGARVFAASQSQTAPQHDHDAAAPSQSTDMMKMHQQMMGDMKAADEKLDQLVKAMNAAKGDAKVDAIAEVVNALVNEHKSMRGRMNIMMMSNGGMMK